MFPGKTYTPKDILQALKRRLWWIAVPFVLLAAASLLFTLSLTHNYRSVATIQVLPEPTTNTLVRATVQPTVGDRLSSVGQETLTRARLEQIIGELGLYEEMRASTVMENVITRMRGDITFQMTDRDVFQVGFTATTPGTALTVAERLTSLFLHENAKNRGERAEAAMQFLASQLDDARKELEAQEKRVEEFRVQHGGELPTQLAGNTQELNNTQLRLRALVESKSRDHDQKLFLQRQLEFAQSAEEPAGGGVISRGSADEVGDGTSGDTIDLARAEANLRALEMRLTAEHPDLQRVRRQVATLREKTTAGGTASGSYGSHTRRVNPRVREIQGQIELLDRQLASRVDEERELRARISNYSRRIEATPVRESELATLNRDYEDTRRLYSTLLQRQQEATMAADLERRNIGDRFRVIEPARLPEKPFSPNRRNYFLIALLISFGFSVSLGVVLEYRDSSLRTEEDITGSLRLPVLATIPVLNGTAHGRSR